MVPLNHVANFKDRDTHGDAQGFSLIGAGDDAAIVIGEHEHGAPLQIGAKQTLAAAKEVIAVDQEIDPLKAVSVRIVVLHESFLLILAPV